MLAYCVTAVKEDIMLLMWFEMTQPTLQHKRCNCQPNLSMCNKVVGIGSLGIALFINRIWFALGFTGRHIELLDYKTLPKNPRNPTISVNLCVIRT